MGNSVYLEVGGIRKGDSFWSAMNQTWPFARLEIFEEKIVLSYFLRGRIEFQKNEINYIEQCRGLFSRGIRIHHSKSGVSPFVLFWSFSIDRLMSKIKEIGYPVK